MHDFDVCLRDAALKFAPFDVSDQFGFCFCMHGRCILQSHTTHLLSPRPDGLDLGMGWDEDESTRRGVVVVVVVAPTTHTILVLARLDFSSCHIDVDVDASQLTD